MAEGAMVEGYQAFLDFDWSDEGWQTYLEGLYPPPNARQILRFKKKWYKRNINPDFDDTWEPAPPSPPPATSQSTGSGGGGRSSPMPGAYYDGSRWAVMGVKSTICFGAYALALTLAIGAFAGVFPPYQALVVLVGAFILEILAKYGLKFKTEYLHAVLLDDVGVMPMMALTLLTPGLHPIVRIVALVPPSLTALLSFSQICEAHARLPGFVRNFFSPLAETSAHYQVMQSRADVEVALGFVLIVAVFLGCAPPFAAILFWNFMMMRYVMSPWTQATFRKMDGFLNPVFGKIPGIKQCYAAIKRGLYSFVDPDSKRAGHLCSIL